MKVINLLHLVICCLIFSKGSIFAVEALTQDQIDILALEYYYKFCNGGELVANAWLDSNLRGKKIWGESSKILEDDQNVIKDNAVGKLIGDKLPFMVKDFDNWKKRCSKLPGCIDLIQTTLSGSNVSWDDFGYYQGSALGDNKIAARAEYKRALDRVIHSAKINPSFIDRNSWLNYISIKKDLLIADDTYKFAQKAIYDDNDIVIFFGDLHGDIHSLLQAIEILQKKGYMRGFEVTNSRVELVFLGDYVDRGMYGVEVVYTLMRIMLASPDNVKFVRGNHEDFKITQRYGFQKECKQKLDDVLEDEHKTLYNSMPVVLYVGHGNNFLQCCHGGLEVGYNPSNFLDSDKQFDAIAIVDQLEFMDDNSDLKLQMAGFVPETFRSFKDSPNLGFMWNDFLKTEKGFSYTEGRGIACGGLVTQNILKIMSSPKSKIRGVVRAHQHTGSIRKFDADNLMGELIESNGFYSMWQPVSSAAQRPLPDKETVFMLNVAADTPYGNDCRFGFSTVAALSFKSSYSDWRFHVVTSQVVSSSVLPGIAYPLGGATEDLPVLLPSKWRSNSFDLKRLALMAGWRYKEDVPDILPEKVPYQLTSRLIEGITADQVRDVLIKNPNLSSNDFSKGLIELNQVLQLFALG